MVCSQLNCCVILTWQGAKAAPKLPDLIPPPHATAHVVQPQNAG